VSSFGLSDLSKRLANVRLMVRACFYDFFLPRLTLRAQLINPQLLQIARSSSYQPSYQALCFAASLALSRRLAFSPRFANQRPTNEKRRTRPTAKTNSSAR